MPTFDTTGFFEELRRVTLARGLTIEEVVTQTGVSASTLAGMSDRASPPDCGSLAALSLWAGINPARFSGLVLPASRHGNAAIAGIRPPNSWCETCDASNHGGLRTRLSLCPICGNKRSPCAGHHDAECATAPAEQQANRS